MHRVIAGFLVLSLGTLMIGCQGVEPDATVSAPESAPIAPAESVFVAESVPDALTLAQVENRAIVLKFTADWCVPCRLMTDEVVRNPDFEEAWGDRIVFVEIDTEVEENYDIVDKYDIGPIPALVVLNPEGAYLGTILGYNSPDHFEKLLKEVLERTPRA